MNRYTEDDLNSFSRDEFKTIVNTQGDEIERLSNEISKLKEAYFGELNLSVEKENRMLKGLIKEYAEPDILLSWRIDAMKYSNKELKQLLHAAIEGHKYRADLWCSIAKVARKNGELFPEFEKKPNTYRDFIKENKRR